MTEIAYLTHMRLPTEKAYGIQMVNTVKALAKNGAEVIVLNTYHKNHITEDVFSYYGIQPNAFKYKRLVTLKFLNKTRLGFWLSMLSFSLSVYVFLLRRKHMYIYSREPFPLLFLSLLGYRTVYEMHDFPGKFLLFHKILCRSASNVLFTNAWAYKNATEQFMLDPKHTLLVPNGYDEERFGEKIDKYYARGKLGISKDDKVILYSGHLYEWKGVDVIADVAKRMPEKAFYLVGGMADEQDSFKKRNFIPDNVYLVSHQKSEAVPYYLAAADVLLLPNLPINRHSEFSTSPIKIFEYMAAARPIVASDLFSIRSIVTSKEVLFAKPGDVEDWIFKISECFDKPDETKERTINAGILVKGYSWESKAKKILSIMS